jgi:hypothetical protein
VLKEEPHDIDLLVLTRAPVSRKQLDALVRHHFSIPEVAKGKLAVEPVFLSPAELRALVRTPWTTWRDDEAVKGAIYRSMLGMKNKNMGNQKEVSRLKGFVRGYVSNTDRLLWLGKRLFAEMPKEQKEELVNSVALHWRQRVGDKQVMAMVAGFLDDGHFARAQEISKIVLRDSSVIKRGGAKARGIITEGVLVAVSNAVRKKEGRDRGFSLLGLGPSRIGC